MSVTFSITVLERDELIRHLMNVSTHKAELVKKVKRKKSLRLSEKAMWLSSLDVEIKAIEMGINALMGKVEVQDEKADAAGAPTP